MKLLCTSLTGRQAFRPSAFFCAIKVMEIYRDAYVRLEDIFRKLKEINA